MFRGPHFIVSTMQEETTPIFKCFWYDWTQQQPGIEPTNPLGQCWVPPIVNFYEQQGLLRTYSSPRGSIRSPHPGSPRWKKQFVSGLNTIVTKTNHKLETGASLLVLERKIIVISCCGANCGVKLKNYTGSCVPIRTTLIPIKHSDGDFVYYGSLTSGQLLRDLSRMPHGNTFRS